MSTVFHLNALEKSFLPWIFLLLRTVFLVWCIPTSLNRADRQECVKLLYLELLLCLLHFTYVWICSILQTLNVLLSYRCINPSNLIYWQQDLVSQHFLLLWFLLHGVPGSPSLRYISSLNLSCSCLCFLLCLSNWWKRPPSSSYLCFFSLKTPFMTLLFSIFGILLYTCPATLLTLHPQPELHTGLHCQSQQVLLYIHR